MRIFFLFLFLLLALPVSAADKKGISLIRDAETEAFLKNTAYPIFREAGLVPENIRIYVVNDSVLNAYVAGGMNMFINTGLLTWSDDPRVIAGVMAHETGHIAGGHLARGQGEIERASIGTMLSYVLGAATIAAGAPAAGQAILTGGSHLAESSFLRYTRGKEESADQAAVKYMDALNISPDGLVKLLEELNAQQHRAFEQINPYTQTHPLSTERIQFIRSAMATAHSASAAATPQDQARYARITAKILAFLSDPEQVRRRYPPSDKSFPARYAAAVLAHREGDEAKAIQIISALEAENPQDGYIAELKGQIYYEHGSIPESIAAYRRAVQLLPQEPLLRLGLGVSLLNSNTPQDLQAAIVELKRVTEKERDDALAWRQLGIAYGKMGEMGESYLALAEEAMMRRDRKDAGRFIQLAKQNAGKNAAISLRADDMQRVLKKWKDDKDDDE